MTIKFIHLFAAFLLFITACSSNSNIPNVSSVTFRESTGPVDPVTVWNEQYTISSKGLTFERSGYSELTTANTGTWTVNGYGANETELFRDLSGHDVYSVYKIGQSSLPIGGGLKIYTVIYDNGEKKEVIIGDGSIYNNAPVITTPINSYIENVVLPVDAAKRYNVN